MTSPLSGGRTTRKDIQYGRLLKRLGVLRHLCGTGWKTTIFLVERPDGTLNIQNFETQVNSEIGTTTKNYLLKKLLLKSGAKQVQSPTGLAITKSKPSGCGKVPKIPQNSVRRTRFGDCTGKKDTQQAKLGLS